MKNLIDCEEKKKIGIMTKEFVETDYGKDGKFYKEEKTTRRPPRKRHTTQSYFRITTCTAAVEV